MRGLTGEALENYFRVDCCRLASDSDCSCRHSDEMTKWVDINYLYIVQEFVAGASVKLDSSRLLKQLEQSHQQGVKAKPVPIGPVTMRNR